MFVNIPSSVHTLKTPASLESWIIGLTINTVRRELRSRGTRRAVQLVPELPRATRPGDTSTLTRRACLPGLPARC